MLDIYTVPFWCQASGIQTFVWIRTHFLGSTVKFTVLSNRSWHKVCYSLHNFVFFNLDDYWHCYLCWWKTQNCCTSGLWHRNLITLAGYVCSAKRVYYSGLLHGTTYSVSLVYMYMSMPQLCACCDGCVHSWELDSREKQTGDFFSLCPGFILIIVLWNMHWKMSQVRMGVPLFL